MWIGAAPSSTGGGIRVTTLFIAFLALLSTSKGKSETSFMDRSIAKNTVNRSLLVIFFSQFMLIVITIIIISSNTHIGLIDAYFETSSAFGTTGLSLGITTSLNYVGKISIILLMFIGQLGVSTTILLSNDKKSVEDKQVFPEEDVLIN